MAGFGQRTAAPSASAEQLTSLVSRDGSLLPRPFDSIRTAIESVSLPTPVEFDDCVNVSALSLPYLLSLFDMYASLGQFACYLESGNRYGRLTSQSDPRKLARRGRLEVFIVDSSARLIDVVSVRLWVKQDALYLTHDARAPLRHIPLHLDVGTPIPTESSIDFPIDAVVTWVDSADPNWQAMISEHADAREIDYDRYTSTDEIRYAIRSIEAFAPWVRVVHVLSNCRPPKWFEPSARVNWVDHASFGDTSILPLFNSHSIELLMSGIPDLAEHFIYFNDDMIIGRPVRKTEFFTRDGKTIARLEPYGRVLEFRDTIGLPEWQMAAANGAKLIFGKFGYFPTQLHQHVPYALRKSLLIEMEEQFPIEFGRTRRARFRTAEDISPVSFLYHHYAIASNRALASTAATYIVRARNFTDFKRKYDRGIVYDHVCINDGEGSHADKKFKNFKRDFLPQLAPFKASCESLIRDVHGRDLKQVFAAKSQLPAKQQDVGSIQLAPWRRPLHKVIAMLVAHSQAPDDRQRFQQDPLEYLSKAKSPVNRLIGKILLRKDQRPY